MSQLSSILTLHVSTVLRILHVNQYFFEKGEKLKVVITLDVHKYNNYRYLYFLFNLSS